MEEIKIVDLPEMKVASFHAIDKQPELVAFAKLQEWAQPNGIFNEPGKYSVFGFNNPPPEFEGALYGYEFWVELGPEIDTEGFTVKHVPARTYAMMRSKGFENIGPNWMKLMEWVKNSDEWEIADGQCLEGHIPGCKYTEDDFRLDIYEPVRRKILNK